MVQLMRAISSSRGSATANTSGISSRAERALRLILPPPGSASISPLTRENPGRYPDGFTDTSSNPPRTT
jgi:hypothetical protein